MRTLVSQFVLTLRHLSWSLHHVSLLCSHHLLSMVYESKGELRLALQHEKEAHLIYSKLVSLKVQLRFYMCLRLSLSPLKFALAGWWGLWQDEGELEAPAEPHSAGCGASWDRQPKPQPHTRCLCITPQSLHSPFFPNNSQLFFFYVIIFYLSLSPQFSSSNLPAILHQLNRACGIKIR